MDELLRERILRRLENLPNDKAYQVLDYIEFLESKFASRSGPSTLEKIADRVEDTLRAGRVSVSAIKGTREVFDAAGRVMQGLADAGKTVVDELQAPVKGALVKEAPVKEAVVKEAVVKEAVVKEVPVKEALVKEAPVKAAPVTAAPVKKATGKKKDGAAAKKKKKDRNRGR